MRLWALLFAGAGILFAAEHPILRLPTGSFLVSEDEDEGEMVLSFRGEEGRVRETVRGRHWSLEYDVAELTRDAIVDFFASQAKELEGGEVLRQADNRLTFRFRRPDGGTTWCDLWATDGNYALEIVDTLAETVPPAPEPESPRADVGAEPEVEILLGTVAFTPGTATLAPGNGALLDAVAARAKQEPTRRLVLRGSRTVDEPDDLAERRGRVVAEALGLHGIGAHRMDVTTGVAEDAGRVDVFFLPE